MADRIFIRNLRLQCIIGIFPHERKTPQDVVINVTLDCPSFSKAAASDDIQDAIDYNALTQRIVGLVEPSEFQLIETLAERIAALCLEDERVLATRVTVDKPQALERTDSVAVEVFRERGDG